MANDWLAWVGGKLGLSFQADQYKPVPAFLNPGLYEE
jgi:hypothetical protein